MKQIIATAQAPQAIGPYSQAVKTVNANLVFCSGQIALDPQTGAILGGSAAEQCRQVLSNLSAVLQAAGSSLEAVVKTTVYLVDMAEFVAVNEVYAEFFSEKPPARAAVAVAELPKGAKIMIDAIAI
ncbi:MAG: Rid family detoxifying hydrolase [bacterium]